MTTTVTIQLWQTEETVNYKRDYYYEKVLSLPIVPHPGAYIEYHPYFRALPVIGYGSSADQRHGTTAVGLRLVVSCRGVVSLSGWGFNLDEEESKELVDAGWLLCEGETMEHTEADKVDYLIKTGAIRVGV